MKNSNTSFPQNVIKKTIALKIDAELSPKSKRLKRAYNG